MRWEKSCEGNARAAGEMHLAILGPETGERGGGDVDGEGRLVAEDVGLGGDGLDLAEDARLEEDPRERLGVGPDGWRTSKKVQRTV